MVYMVKKVARRVRKSYRRKPAVAKTSGRRRLMPAAVLAGAGLAVAKRGYTKYQQYKTGLVRAQKKAYVKSVQTAQKRIEQSDNIANAPTIKIGTPRSLNFNEKVARVATPPVIYKRNYQWSAECPSGRKAIFGIAVNDLNVNKTGGGGLYEDIMTQGGVQRMTTDTATADPTIIANSVGATMQQFYVDYLSEKLSMVNSGSNSLTGKLKLWSYKRDCEGSFTNTNCRMNPINIAMYGSQTGGNVSLNGQNEGGLGVYGFDAATAGVNFTANYEMPGSAQNTGGATMYCDLGFDLMGPQIKDFTGYFFKLQNTLPFSLKPGQQINQTLLFNDLPLIHRAAMDMVYIRGVSFYITIEFQAGIVGDTTVANQISTGSAQLSCMLVEKRIVGLYNKHHTKLVMPTAAPAGIAISNQVIINADTGIQDVAYEEDA